VSRELLGHATAPSGIIVVLDMGALGLWSHDQHPTFPEGEAPPNIVEIANTALDWVVRGPDAVAAAKLFTPQPPYLYDRPPSFVRAFTAKCSEAGLKAMLVPLDERVPHRTRVARAVSGEQPFGVVEFHGLWAAAIGGLPRDRAFTVTATRDGEEGEVGWRHVELIVQPKATVVRTETVGSVLVDHARLAFIDADALGAWEHDEPIDGLADYVFWGRDAQAVAEKMGVPALGPGEYGWKQVPIDRLLELGMPIEDLRDAKEFKFATDFRPHSHHYQVMEQVRGSATESGTLEVGGAKLCGFMTSWGDGCFDIERDVDPHDQTVTIRIVFTREGD
jgi:hypothetical protein